MSRIYRDFHEAQNEIRRDLAELGVEVKLETMQHFDVKGDEEIGITMELMNYQYTVVDPDYTKLEGVHEEWVKQEWRDRRAGGLNPGLAWKKRKEIWRPLMEYEGKAGAFARSTNRPTKFSYTYSERMGGPHIQRVIDEIKEHPHTRQAWLPVWGPIDETRRGKRRVPCSLGYQFLWRQGKLHVTYVMRSCDFFLHYANDVALATILMKYIARETGLEPGTFSHFVGSLHVYKKDVADVF